MNKSILLGGLMAALACGPAGAAASDKAAPAVPAQAGVLSGKVVETMNAATYTYVLVETGTAKALAAAPEFAVKLLYGEMAQILFASQRVQPQAALKAGFQFQFPQLPAALAAIYS